MAKIAPDAPREGALTKTKLANEPDSPAKQIDNRKAYMPKQRLDIPPDHIERIAVKDDVHQVEVQKHRGKQAVIFSHPGYAR